MISECGVSDYTVVYVTDNFITSKWMLRLHTLTIAMIECLRLCLIQQSPCLLFQLCSTQQCLFMIFNVLWIFYRIYYPDTEIH